METNEIRLPSKPLQEQREPWHKPELQRLKVVLDTLDGSGSSADLYVFTGQGG
jgi:hypothetical protein